MNWQGEARSNYFQVKDSEKFKAAMRSIGVTVEEGDGKNAGKFAVFAADGEGWPSSVIDEEINDVVEVDVVDTVVEHLASGSVAVFMQVGHEGSRYVNADAVAIDSTGERVEIGLDEIYDRAKTKFPNREVTRASH